VLASVEVCVFITFGALVLLNVIAVVVSRVQDCKIGCRRRALLKKKKEMEEKVKAIKLIKAVTAPVATENKIQTGIKEDQEADKESS